MKWKRRTNSARVVIVTRLNACLLIRLHLLRGRTAQRASAKIGNIRFEYRVHDLRHILGGRNRLLQLSDRQSRLVTYDRRANGLRAA